MEFANKVGGSKPSMLVNLFAVRQIDVFSNVLSAPCLVKEPTSSLSNRATMLKLLSSSRSTVAP